MLGEYNKNSADPLRKLFEVQREHAFTTHTYKHTTMGFLKDIEDMPNQFEYSKMFFDRWYRPEHTTLIVAGDVTPATGDPAGREVLGRLEARAATRSKIPAEPAPKAPVYAHVAWTTPTLPLGDGGLPRPGLLGDGQGLGGASTCCSTSPSAPPRPVQAAGGGGAEGRPAVPLPARERGPVPGQRGGAREEARRRAVRARRDPGDLRRAARASRCPPSAWRTRSPTRATA